MTHKQNGMVLPAVMMTLVLISSVMVMLSNRSAHGVALLKIDQAASDTYLAAEGAVNKQIADMSVFGTLWEEKASLATVPSAYTQYTPLIYYSTNGIPPCVGIACHRHLYPLGGGLLKNLGPVNGDGDFVDAAYPITEQLDPLDLPETDLTLGPIKAWTQVERLDETTPGSSSVGGSLTNSIAEGGNAKTVRYRVTGIATKTVKARRGYATVVSVVEMPLT